MKRNIGTIVLFVMLILTVVALTQLDSSPNTGVLSKVPTISDAAH